MGKPTTTRSDDCMDMIDAYVEHIRRTSPSGSKATPMRRREVLTLLDRELPRGLDRTCTEELEDWLHAGCNHRTGAPWSQNTKATYCAAIKSAYAFWADPADPWIDEDPAADLTPVRGVKGVARPGSEEQLTHILTHGAEPYRTWTLIAAYQGLRCVELSALNREHITRETLMVLRGKGGKPRSHDTDPLVWDAVRDLPPGPVCRDMWGRERASAYYISRMASRYFSEQLGFEGLTMHMWRHRLGVQAQRLYKNARVTQKLLGHETLSATQIYTDADFDEQRAARAMLPRPHAA